MNSQKFSYDRAPVRTLFKDASSQKDKSVMRFLKLSADCSKSQLQELIFKSLSPQVSAPAPPFRPLTSLCRKKWLT